MSSFKMADEIQDGRQFVRDFFVILDFGGPKKGQIYIFDKCVFYNF